MPITQAVPLSAGTVGAPSGALPLVPITINDSGVMTIAGANVTSFALASDPAQVVLTTANGTTTIRAADFANVCLAWLNPGTVGRPISMAFLGWLITRSLAGSSAITLQALLTALPRYQDY